MTDKVTIQGLQFAQAQPAPSASPQPDGAQVVGSDPVTAPAIPPAPDATPAASPAWWLESIDFSQAYQLLERGGPVVAILAVLSVIALTVILLKSFQFLSSGVGTGRGVEQALHTWSTGDTEKAIDKLARYGNPAARVLHHAMGGLARGVPEATVREDAERVALGQLASLKSYLRILESTSQIAPLLGLFGTVIGMMSAFQALQTSGSDADPAILAGGIWVALITTAVGLAVAIPTAFTLYWFEGRIERERSAIEAALTSLFTGRLTVTRQAANKSASQLYQPTGAPHAAE